MGGGSGRGSLGSGAPDDDPVGGDPTAVAEGGGKTTDGATPTVPAEIDPPAKPAKDGPGTPGETPSRHAGADEASAVDTRLRKGIAAGRTLLRELGKRTIDVSRGLDEDAFFTGVTGDPTVVDRYDLEKAVPSDQKPHFAEVNRYWVNKPFAFVVVFHSERENEEKYYVVEPHLTNEERDLLEFLREKLTDSIKYSWNTADDDSPAARARVIERETYDLLARYRLRDKAPDTGATGLLGAVRRWLGSGRADDGRRADRSTADGDSPGSMYPDTETLGRLEGIAARPDSAVLSVGDTSLSEFQVEKLLYYLRRDFVGYGRIDPIKHDVNVEDISCDGYDSPVFVYHTDHEQLITNLAHGRDELDAFVVKLAQRSGKSISKREPQVDSTLPDGSRAQLTLGHEVSDRGTNYTIRQFKDVPYTPVDLINWNTFSLDQVALLWLCIGNYKSTLFAGGTASGKTTSLNALSLFIPSDAKIVSIEDTREVELPQRNWVASVTRPSLAADDKGDVDEFDLLEASLRQRPDYIVMGEVRGEEGRTLFQMMSTGHTTYTTFHADTVGEVIDRFTTDPINVSKSLFTALDLIAVQTQTRVKGRKVRRNKTLTEINHYDAELDEVNVQDISQWQPDTDTFKQRTAPGILEDIKFDRGWTDERLDAELFKRRTVLAYLVDRNVTDYAEVAATIQGFISDSEALLALMAQDRLQGALADLRTMESVKIDIDPEKEEMVPRPDPPPAIRDEAAAVLTEAAERLFPDYADHPVGGIEPALADLTEFDWNTGFTDDQGWAGTDPVPGESNDAGDTPEGDA